MLPAPYSGISPPLNIPDPPGMEIQGIPKDIKLNKEANIFSFVSSNMIKNYN
jgi:hypothetical protein